MAQDADGVLFQANDEQTARLVGLYRYFLKDDILGKLHEEQDGGTSLFDESLARVMSLSVPHLQKVVTGGFDEVDDTPFFVTEWAGGMSLAEAHEQNVFSAEDGLRFEAQARVILAELSEEFRSALCFNENKIFVCRQASGEWDFQFLLSPTRYFGNIGGMVFGEEDKEEVLREMRAHFPELEMAGDEEAEGEGVSVLESANQFSGLGILWGVLAAVIVALGVAGTVLFYREKPDDAQDSRSSLAEQTNVEVEDDLQADVIDDSSDYEGEPIVTLAEEPEIEETEIEAPVLLVNENEVSAFEAASEVATTTVKLSDSHSESEVPSSSPSRPVLIRSEEELAEVIAPQEPEALEFDAGTDYEKLIESEGKSGTLTGVVEDVGESGGKKTLWYLDFNKGEENHIVGVFRRINDPESGDFSEWRSLINKRVKVSGRFKLVNRSGTRPAVLFKRRTQLTVLNDLTVHSVTHLPSIFTRGLYRGEQIVAEGKLVDFGKGETAGYLIFEGAENVRGRFLFDSEFGGDIRFRKNLASMKGKKVRMEGVLQEDRIPELDVVVQIERADAIQLIEVE